MRLSQEEKEAVSLNKEFLMLKKYAERPGASKSESDYYWNMANRTRSKINFKLLEPHKKEAISEETEERYEFDNRKFRKY